jgi:sulfur-oxidizing protein SoxY
VTSRASRRKRLVDRRTLLGSLAGLLAAVAGARALKAEGTTGAAPEHDASLDAPPAVPTPQYNEAFAKVVGSGTPAEERLALNLPEYAENGSIVPYKISVESPMTADDYIAEVHLLSTQNPQPAVAVFHFTPLSGKAAVSGRMRLAKTQDVVAVAVTSGNKLLMARQTVAVGIGGCGTD